MFAINKVKAFLTDRYDFYLSYSRTLRSNDTFRASYEYFAALQRLLSALATARDTRFLPIWLLTEFGRCFQGADQGFQEDFAGKSIGVLTFLVQSKLIPGN